MQFFAESKQDDLTMSALQMTLKDLLTHYMGMNEGIINMLEHYFDMSRRDAERSLDLYKRFCWQTEKVVAFLDAARRLSYRLRAAIPSLNHAPVSLASALEEYLHGADDDEPPRERAKADAPRKAPDAARDAPAPKAPEAAPKAPKASKDASQQALQDFFEALEQPSASSPFQAAYASFAGFHAQPDWFQGTQPTGWGMAPQATGANPFAPMPTGAWMAPHATGWNPFQAAGAPAALVPQPTMATTPFEQIFGQMRLDGGEAQGAQGASKGGPFAAQPAGGQPTGGQPAGGQPAGGPFGSQPSQPFGSQPTGQPFGTQPTGQPFGSQSSQPFGAQPTGTPFGTQPTGTPFGTQPTGTPFAAQPTGTPFATQPTGAFGPFATQPSPAPSSGIPPAIAQRLQAQRTASSAPASPKGTPAAVPAKVSFATATPPPKPDSSTSSAPKLKPQKTGSMNPFSIPSDFEEPAPPPQPKQPSLAELASQSWLGTNEPLVQEPTSMPEPMAPQSTGLMSSIASEFARPGAGGSAAPHSASISTAAAAPPRSASISTAAAAPPRNASISTSAAPPRSASFAPEPFGAASGGAPPDPWARPLGPQRTGAGTDGPWSAAPKDAAGAHGPMPSIWGSVSPAWDTQPRASQPWTPSEALRTSSFDVSGTAPLDTQRTGAPSHAFPSAFSPSGRSHTGLGISSHTADASATAPRADLAPHATGGTPSFAGAGFSSPFSASSPTFPNPHQPTGLASQPTGLTSQPTGFGGIKPFQPTSSFGHSLLKHHGQAPDAAPARGAAPPTQDLLQL